MWIPGFSGRRRCVCRLPVGAFPGNAVLGGGGNETLHRGGEQRPANARHHGAEQEKREVSCQRQEQKARNPYQATRNQ